MRDGVLHHAAEDLAVRHVAVEADGFLFVLDARVGDDEQDGEHADDRADDQDRQKLMH